MSTIGSSEATAPFVLALDLGTSSIRAMLFDSVGRAVEGMTVRHPHEVRTTSAGASEADPDAMVERVWRCIDELLELAGPLSGSIGGVGACTFVTNFLGIDGDGDAITPCYTYADTRAAADAATLRDDLDEEIVHQRTGCLIHTSYLPARFRWLDRTHPELLDRAERWVSIGEYMELKLFGETRVSTSVASWTGLLDRERLVWDQPLLDKLPVEEGQLSPLVDVHDGRTGLRPPFAERWPALRDVPWFPAAGDGATANVGSGCVTPERIALTVGTTSAVRAVVTESPERVPNGLWCYRVDDRRSLPGGALTEGGNVFAWLTETLDLPEVVAVDGVLAEMEPDSHNLTVLPFLAGERSPGWVGDARATLHGLSLATTPVEILRAGMEAVAYRIGLIFKLMHPLLADEVQVITSGGALRNSSTWAQIMADVLGHPVILSEVGEASARGTVLLTLEALGELEDLKEAPAFLGQSVQPSPDHHERYREAMARQQALYNKLVHRD